MRYCNALKATQANGLGLEIALDGYFRDGRMGYFPTQSNEMNKLRTNLYNMMSNLAGGGCKDAKASEIYLGFNEPNYKQRYKADEMGKKLANLLIYLVPLLRKDARNLGIALNISAADLALSEPNDPLRFIDEFGQRIKESIKPGDQFPFDRWGLNYYAAGQFTRDNLQTRSRVASLEKVVEMLRTRFGKSLPISITELGAFSNTPNDKVGLYSKPVPPTVQIFSGNEQGKFYDDIIRQAACLGLVGVLIFHKSDDKDDHLRTGTAYPDGSQKPSEPIVRQAFADALAGTVKC